jgi:hypothetical protein
VEPLFEVYVRFASMFLMQIGQLQIAKCKMNNHNQLRVLSLFIPYFGLFTEN